MQIRDLTADDLFLLSGIIEKISADLAEKLVNEMSERQVGITMALTVARYIPTEIRAFLAHVTDQTPEELGKQPFAEPVRILKALWQKEDFKDFLQEVKSMREVISQK